MHKMSSTELNPFKKNVSKHTICLIGVALIEVFVLKQHQHSSFISQYVNYHDDKCFVLLPLFIILVMSFFRQMQMHMGHLCFSAEDYFWYHFLPSGKVEISKQFFFILETCHLRFIIMIL